MKLNNFDVLKEMGHRNRDIKMVSLANFLGANYRQKQGYTRIEMAVPGNVCLAFLQGGLVGGLIFASKVEFDATAKELEHSAHDLAEDGQYCAVCGLHVDLFERVPSCPGK